MLAFHLQFKFKPESPLHKRNLFLTKKSRRLKTHQAFNQFYLRSCSTISWHLASAMLHIRLNVIVIPWSRLLNIKNIKKTNGEPYEKDLTSPNFMAHEGQPGVARTSPMLYLWDIQYLQTCRVYVMGILSHYGPRPVHIYTIHQQHLDTVTHNKLHCLFKVCSAQVVSSAQVLSRAHFAHHTIRVRCGLRCLCSINRNHSTSPGRNTRGQLEARKLTRKH